MTHSSPAATATSADGEIRLLYEHLLEAWNRRAARAMAALFAANGSMVGFDGSQANGRSEIEAHLAPIFADHPTAAYVAKVREVRFLGSHIALLRAVAGMVPPGARELNPALN
ncbi:MAG TPA: SgcJ/EcaC family oxidoreductase [Longimicrobiales bacterium]|nr:SgcJ/EcaC family oxidoreductase [Longimicrobiales bacterium]